MPGVVMPGVVMFVGELEPALGRAPAGPRWVSLGPAVGGESGADSPDYPA
jgi:hypothetical protein